MKPVERPGVDQRWLRTWKADCRNLIKWRDIYGPQTTRELDHYARHGKRLTPPGYEPSERNPPYASWERADVNAGLVLLALIRLFEVERRGMEGEPFDSALAMHGFAAAYTSQVIDLDTHNKSLARFGEPQNFLTMDALAFTALGVVVGCKKEALKLARAQIAAHRKGWFGDADDFPVYTFILRVLASHLGERDVRLSGKSRSERIFSALFDGWRSQDIEALAHVCLAACDSHTHRCKSGEFDQGEWTRTPIEILLLLKLRELAGLQNPQLDHPLMNTPLGRLPEEVAFAPDDLVKRVRARMTRDGYDEEAILVKACKAQA